MWLYGLMRSGGKGCLVGCCMVADHDWDNSGFRLLLGSAVAGCRSRIGNPNRVKESTAIASDCHDPGRKVLHRKTIGVKLK